MRKLKVQIREHVRRWAQAVNRSMPVLLDMTGIILLSGAAMVWHLIAGLVAAGIGCFVLNWRIYSSG
ncbi:hypothetical protein ACIQHU_26445 [Streptomyces tendae]|uniref:hypothetical protein n=1 Tax=Streptomyces tendae TaxID=1932 RepID=UPI0038183809